LRAKKILKRPNAVELIKNLSKSAEAFAKKCGLKGIAADTFKSFDIEITVKDNDIIKLSNNLTVMALETPGHTRDCITYYIPEKKTLFCSESLGIQDKTGYIFNDFLIDYDIYFDSMKRINALETDVICTGHNYSYTGDDALRFKQNAIESCESFLNMAETFLLEEHGNIDAAVNRIKKIEYDGKTGFVQPEQAYLLNLEARIGVVKKRMGENI
jgi:glyoxylase-like metal-dependent hydrolase (beta-lactamase superfamily II)